MQLSTGDTRTQSKTISRTYSEGASAELFCQSEQIWIDGRVLLTERAD